MDTLPEHVKEFPSPAMLRTVSIGLVLLALGVAMVEEKPVTDPIRRRGPVTTDYENQWRRSAHVDLVKTLSSNGVTGCVDMAYRPHRTYSGEYLVYCSEGGKWQSWMAWTSTQTVKGPYPPDPLVPMP